MVSSSRSFHAKSDYSACLLNTFITALDKFGSEVFRVIDLIEVSRNDNSQRNAVLLGDLLCLLEPFDAFLMTITVKFGNGISTDKCVVLERAG